MYGLVHRGIADLVTRALGEEGWEQVKRGAGVEDVVFLSHEPYPDEMTSRLVVGAAAALGISVDEALEAFGEHWVLEIAPQGYAQILDAAGGTLPEFLEALPRLHARVLLHLPHLRPPRFEVSDRTATSLRVHYRSHRDGLQAFVVGLLRGLGKRFDVAISIVHEARRDQGADHDVFRVSWT